MDAPLGFLFAFHTVPADQRVGLEALVSFFSNSTIVHVEMLPVYHVTENAELCVHHAYTAYVQRRFGCYAPCVLDLPGTLLLFMPTTRESGLVGLNFLHSLMGVPYNYAGLPRTLMSDKYRRSADPWHVPHAVFCSEAGLQLAYLCDALCLPTSFECTPAELFTHLSQKAHVWHLPRSRVLVATQ
jgi:hypothetical protein